MDDDAIPRRDAVVGLGMMGMLLVALVGTIGVRIANSSRDQAGPPRRSIEAVAATAEATTGDVAIAPGAADAPTPHDFIEVQPATHEQYAPAAQRDSQAPRFIAPSSR